jgi:hypothetical protein
MVVVNGIISAFLGLSVLVYRFVFPKKKLNLFILLILISILPIVSIFRAGVYQSGDFNLHIYRSIDFYRSLTEGYLAPSWAGNLNATYGYPLFIFNYTLPYYLISFFHALGLNFILSMKFFLALTFLFSAVFSYFLGKELFKNDLAALTLSIFYLFSPYHLIDQHFKISIGEIFFITLLPLFFIYLIRAFKNKGLTNALSAGLILGILTLSHVYLAAILIPITFIYLIYFGGINFNTLKVFFTISLIGIICSAYQWAPTLIYNSYLFTNVHPIDTAALFYPSAKDLLYSPWRFGFLFQGPKGEISSLIGYAQLLVILISAFLLLKGNVKENLKKNLIFYLCLSFALILFMTPLLKIFWTHIPLISNAGAHRLIIFVVFSISILAGYLSLLFNKKKLLIILILLFTIGSTILNWGNRTMILRTDDKALQAGAPLSTSSGEGHFYANTRWANPSHPWQSAIPKQNLEIINGNSKIIETKRTTTLHEYKINVFKTSTFRENTLFFPGWKIKANNKHVEISVGNLGIINFKLEKGDYILSVYYEDIYPYKIVKIISFFGFLLTLISIFYLQLRKYLFPRSSR